MVTADEIADCLTKLRFLQSNNPVELEGQIEALPFKVEIKSVYAMGGKHWVWFTLLDKDFLVKETFPSVEDKTPPVEKTRKPRKKKIK